MEIYSYYYGAGAGQGIGVRAQSRQLENLPISADLKDLSSMHALDAAERDGEMLSYMLHRGRYSILGLSYIEAPKSSGYSRSAPCGLQYVTAEEGMERLSGELGRIVNFINFQKPSTISPAPLAAFPLNESGYMYHNSPAVLAPLVDGLTRVAASEKNEVLLVALPRGKANGYATARYTIAEALGYLPAALRLNIRFFTGLPVPEGVTDPLVGYENAVKYNANVIFCPGEFYDRLKSYHSFIGLDMDRPGGQAGVYAAYVTRLPEAATGITNVCACLSGPMTYDSLNRAAQQAQRGEIATVESLRSALTKAEKEKAELEKAAERQFQELTNERNRSAELEGQIQYLKRERREAEPRGGRSVLSWILIGVVTVLLMAASAFAAWMISKNIYAKDNGGDAPAPGEVIMVTPAVATASPVLIETTAAPVLIEDTNARENGDIPVVNETSGQPEQPEAEPAGESEPTEAPTPEPTEAPAPTETPAPEPAEVPAEEPEASESMMASNNPDAVNCYGVVISNNGVNFRNNSNLSEENKISLLKNGTYVWILQTETNSENQKWTQVVVNGVKGYIKSEFLRILTEKESSAYMAQFTPIPPELYYMEAPADADDSVG